jgi:predicted RNase H-like HicB family nuclease
MEPEPGVGYFGRTIELPYAMSGGKTPAECAASVLEATTLAVATMLEHGERPPAPASDARREQQLNIRITADERLRLEEGARKAGFRSISDFVRTAALRSA